MNLPSVHPAAAIWASPARQLLVLGGLCGFAISQPLLSILGDSPTILAFYGIDGAGLVVLAALVAFGPPLVLWGLTRAAALTGVRAGRAVHLLAVSGLIALLTIQVAKGAGLHRPFALVLTALVVGVAFAIAYVRVAAVATWATYTAILPVMAFGAFVFTSPSSALLRSTAAPDRVRSAEAPASVVLIVLDELPTRSLLDADDQIDRSRFPNLAALGDEATWYRHFTTIAPLTEAAVPSLLTGTLPTADEGIWVNHPDNLFSLLAPTHELEVLESATRLCPYDTCAPTIRSGATTAETTTVDVGGPTAGDLMGVTWDLWLERISLGPQGPAALDDFVEAVSPSEETMATTSPSITVPPAAADPPDRGVLAISARAEGLIQAFDASKGPALYFLHLILPHQPWHLYPDGTTYDLLGGEELALPVADQRRLFSWSPWTSAVSEQRHLLQAEYTDRIVGQMMQALREEGLYDDSLVIVTADHGVSFESDTAGRYVEPSTIDAIAYSPLLIKEPGQHDGVVDDSNVTIVDVLPTIADRLDLRIPWTVDGASAGSPAIEARGDDKEIYDMVGLGGLQIRRILDFDDRATFATVGDRWIGPLSEPDQPLSALDELLGLDRLIGQRLDDVVTTVGGSVQLDWLDALREPPDGDVRIGVVTGIASGAPRGAKLVLAIDGVVVGGSELSTDSDGRDGRIAVLLPPGALDEENDVRAALVVDGEVRELEVEG